ncbi:hypothetical protein ACN3XK_71745 [Actinomadura welshii]
MTTAPNLVVAGHPGLSRKLRDTGLFPAVFDVASATELRDLSVSGAVPRPAAVMFAPDFTEDVPGAGVPQLAGELAAGGFSVLVHAYFTARGDRFGPGVVAPTEPMSMAGLLATLGAAPPAEGAQPDLHPEPPPEPWTPAGAPPVQAPPPEPPPVPDMISEEPPPVPPEPGHPEEEEPSPEPDAAVSPPQRPAPAAPPVTDRHVAGRSKATPNETAPPQTTPPETDPPETDPHEAGPPSTTPPETIPDAPFVPETAPPQTNPHEAGPPSTSPPETIPDAPFVPETAPPEVDPNEADLPPAYLPQADLHLPGPSPASPPETVLDEPFVPETAPPESIPFETGPPETGPYGGVVPDGIPPMAAMPIPSRRRRLSGPVLAALAVAVLAGVAIGAAGLIGAVRTAGGDGAAERHPRAESAPPESAPAGAPSAPAAPSGMPTSTPTAVRPAQKFVPGQVRITDGRVSIEVAWTDRSGGRAAYYVVGGPAGRPPTTLASAPPGTEKVRIVALNPSVDYCLTVVAVVDVDRVGQSKAVCTHRVEGNG